ncbi:MAG: ATP-binding protein [Nitrospira sp.]|nr:ATP-binding protein [Nitrospira sp.]
MIIIHAVNNLHTTLNRHLTPLIRQALNTFPVVVVTGARQTGKSTLIRELLTPHTREYLTLDDLDVLERAHKEPDALLTVNKRMTIDEIQRSPDLLLAVKRAVDRDRRPGRFLLSGSANLALMRSVSETLAGRAVYLTLYPFTMAERAERAMAGRWQALVDNPSQFEGTHPRFERLEETLLQSGFPPAALSPNPATRRIWLDGYVRTYLERDLQALSTIDHLVDFRRLMRMAALRSAALVNQSDLARDAGLTQPTAHRYLNLLETSYLLYRLPAYAVNRTKRLIKTPRLFFCDTGLAAHLAGIDSVADLKKSGLVGPLLETLVVSDLLAWREGLGARPDILYWRLASGAEVDVVIEQAGTVIPIEVKATSRPRVGDIAHLRLFLNDYGKAAPHGLLLHTGERAERLADRIWAIPLSVALGLDG